MRELMDDPGTLDMPTRGIMSLVSDEVLMVDATATLREAAHLLSTASVGCVVVGTMSKVEGVLSERDLVHAIAAGLDLDATTVADIETKTLKWATPESSVDDVAEEMMEAYVRHVLVGEDRALVGIVSMRDILGAYLA